MTSNTAFSPFASDPSLRSASETSRRGASQLSVHEQRVRQELKQVGFTPFGLGRPEIGYLVEQVDVDESIKAASYGRDESGSMMCIATERRLIVLRGMQGYVLSEEYQYDEITGISYYGGVMATIIVHMKTDTIRIHTFNHHSAQAFVSFIEERCLDAAIGPSTLWRTV
jgi:hypothetical protein